VHRLHKVFDTLGSRPTEAMLARENVATSSASARQSEAGKSSRSLGNLCQTAASETRN